MSLYSPTKILGSYYSVQVDTPNGTVLRKLGKLPMLQEVLESIEDDTVRLKLSSPYFGRAKVAYISHGEMLDLKLATKLGNLGFDVTKATFDRFVDAIRLQEEALEQSGSNPTVTYACLGWIRIPFEDTSTGTIIFKLCYRCSELIGYGYPHKYTGPYDIQPIGSYDAWKQMVMDDVIPYPTLQLTLVAALSAVVVGALAYGIPIENPVLHLNLPSGRGKSTAGYLAASTIGKPFDGTMPELDEDGNTLERQSVYQSWGATDNAMIATQGGNRGVVTVLNELGKSLSRDMTRLIFDLSEGSDKKRLNSDLNTRLSKGYSTTFISTGESSLLDKCSTRLEGLAVRVMEVSKPLTKDAKHANRIKDCCFNNCGHAAPELAKYIIHNGGLDYVLPKYKAWVTELRARFPKGPSMERFVEKFAALFATTAEIATDALCLPFDLKGLLAFLEEYDREHGSERNTSADSHKLILQICESQKHKFFVRVDKSHPQSKGTSKLTATPSQECWGRITHMAKEHIDGNLIVQEFEILKVILEKLLKDQGYSNKSTCIAAWREAGVIDAEDATHPCRSRKIDPNAPTGTSKDVYVLRVFASDDEAAEIRAELQRVANGAGKRQLKLSKASLLLDDITEGDAAHA